MVDKCSQIINIAQNDENIRGVFLYGSRANKNVKPDEYQDFDIYYTAVNIDEFDVSVFTNVKLIFIPSANYPELFEDEHCYLMLFDDDSRIDLTICTSETFLSKHSDGQPVKCLLDKDNITLKNKLHLRENNCIKPIDEKLFSATCLEFLWELQNVAKGLKRDELSYTMFIRDISLRDMLNRIIDTYIGMKNNYNVSVGPLGKYRKNFLSKIQFELYRNTYLSNTSEDIWDSIFYMVELFEELGKCIASEYQYNYPKMETQYMIDYLHRIKDKH